MHPLIDNLLWASSFGGEIALLFIIFFRRHYRAFPAFTAIMAFNISRDVGLFLIRTHFSAHVYFVAYYSTAPPDYLLQLGILYEIARNAVLPGRKRPPSQAFWILGILVLSSILITALVVSHASHSASRWIDNVISTVGLTFSLLRCLLFASITIFSNILGISWRNYVQRVATGLAIYSLIDFVVDYEYMVYHNNTLDYYRIVAYLVSLAYWIWTLSLPEPERKPLAPQVEALVYRVHQAVIADRKLLEDTRDRK